MRKSVIITLILAIVIIPTVAFADAAATYKAKCAACHGADGSKNFTTVATASETDLAKTITDGKKPKMPSYNGKLTAAEITELAKYVKSLKK